MPPTSERRLPRRRWGRRSQDLQNRARHRAGSNRPPLVFTISTERFHQQAVPEANHRGTSASGSAAGVQRRYRARARFPPRRSRRLRDDPARPRPQVGSLPGALVVRRFEQPAFRLLVHPNARVADATPWRPPSRDHARSWRSRRADRRRIDRDAASCDMASRAFTTRLSNTCSSCPSSARTADCVGLNAVVNRCDHR